MAAITELRIPADAAGLTVTPTSLANDHATRTRARQRELEGLFRRQGSDARAGALKSGGKRAVARALVGSLPQPAPISAGGGVVAGASASGVEVKATSFAPPLDTSVALQPSFPAYPSSPSNSSGVKGGQYRDPRQSPTAAGSHSGVGPTTPVVLVVPGPGQAATAMTRQQLARDKQTHAAGRLSGAGGAASTSGILEAPGESEFRLGSSMPGGAAAMGYTSTRGASPEAPRSRLVSRYDNPRASRIRSRLAEATGRGTQASSPAVSDGSPTSSSNRSRSRDQRATRSSKGSSSVGSPHSSEGTADDMMAAEEATRAVLGGIAYSKRHSRSRGSLMSGPLANDDSDSDSGSGRDSLDLTAFGTPRQRERDSRRGVRRKPRSSTPSEGGFRDTLLGIKGLGTEPLLTEDPTEHVTLSLYDDSIRRLPTPSGVPRRPQKVDRAAIEAWRADALANVMQSPPSDDFIRSECSGVIQQMLHCIGMTDAVRENEALYKELGEFQTRAWERDSLMASGWRIDSLGGAAGAKAFSQGANARIDHTQVVIGDDRRPDNAAQLHHSEYAFTSMSLGGGDAAGYFQRRFAEMKRLQTESVIRESRVGWRPPTASDKTIGAGGRMIF